MVNKPSVFEPLKFYCILLSFMRADSESEVANVRHDHVLIKMSIAYFQRKIKKNKLYIRYSKAAASLLKQRPVIYKMKTFTSYDTQIGSQN